MTRWAALLALLLTAAERVEPPKLSPPDTWQPRTEGTLRVLNKIDGRLSTITLRAGQSTTEQSLHITLKACVARPPDLPADFAAHLAIEDSNGAPPFDGWLLAAEPAANVYENAVFDVQLAGCGETEAAKAP